MQIETYIVDAFTNEPFKGNQAGVCILESNLTDEQMLSIAKELGFSETAFIKELSAGQYTIRYFSPKVEIPLCGHATMASSKVLFEKQESLAAIHFHTVEKLVLAISKTDGMITMEFPVYETSPAKAPTSLLEALGISTINNSAYNSETNILLLEIDSSEALANLQPNFEALIQSHDAINGVLITAPSQREAFDYELRYFWPWSGTNEDPVTGGIQTFLAKYWSERLNKNKMMSFQCSERTGFMEVTLQENVVRIKSTAQIVMEGSLRLSS